MKRWWNRRARLMTDPMSQVHAVPGSDRHSGSPSTASCGSPGADEDSAETARWQDLAQQPLIVSFGAAMRHDGLSADGAREALRILDGLPLAEVTQAIDAARAAGLSLANLDVWARVMRSEAAGETRRGRQTWPRRWTLTARMYVAATGGQERLAAWAAAAAWSVEELRGMDSLDGLSEETLRAQAALVWLDSDAP